MNLAHIIAFGVITGASIGAAPVPPTPVQTIIIGAGGELTWKDKLNADRNRLLLERKRKREEAKLADLARAQKAVEKKVADPRYREGALSKLPEIEFKRVQIESGLEKLENEIAALDRFIESMDEAVIEQDDMEVIALI